MRAADLQMVNISLRVLTKPDTDTLATIFKNLGLDWDERVLPSIGNEIIKAVVAQYNAEQLLTQRDKVSKAVSPDHSRWALASSLRGISKERVQKQEHVCLIVLLCVAGHGL